MNSSLRSVIAFSAAVTLATNACSDSNGPGDSSPVMPSPSTMQMDLSFFDENGQAGGGGSVAGVAGSSFFSAAVAVGVARAATFLVLAVPAATYAAAISQEPVFTDGAFHWEYMAMGATYHYNVDLSARPEGNQVFWEMRITSPTSSPPLSNYLWVTGVSNLSGDAGEWHLFDASVPGIRKELLTVDWTHESDTDKSLILTNVNTSSPDVGDQLEFVADGDIRTMRFIDASASTQVLVQWNESTHTGFIEAPNVNGGQRACWNSNLENVGCGG